MGLYQVVLTTLKNSAGELTLNVVEMQQLPDNDTTDLRKEILWLKWAKYIDSWKVCANFMTDIDKLNTLVYRYWTIRTPKIMKTIWKWQKNKSL